MYIYIYIACCILFIAYYIHLYIVYHTLCKVFMICNIYIINKSTSYIVSLIYSYIVSLIYSYILSFFYIIFFPQTVWPDWGVLTVTVKARCSIEVVSRAFGIFPVNFRTNASCDMSMCISTAQVAQNACCGISVRHFPCKFLHKMPLVTCPYAFRLRRLAPHAFSL